MFVITEQAMAELEKGRKRRERERLGQAEEAASAAHAAAEGFQRVMATEREGCSDGDAAMLAAEPDGDTEGDAATKARKATEGPAHPMMPGEIHPEDFGRGYLEAGHAAPSPQHGPPVPHINLTASRGHLTHINPIAPMGPGGNQ
jgi:hypothetical protein